MKSQIALLDHRCHVACLLLFATGVYLIGCGGGPKADYDILELAEVTGTVTLDGEPLSEATVVFEAENRTMAYGTTDSSGRYTLMYNSEQIGVTTGKKTVRISTAGTDSEATDQDGSEGEPESKQIERVPARYNSQSELVRDVKPGSQTFDFKLTSSGS